MKIYLDNISFSYSNELDIFADLTYSLEGEIVALYGRSGCGKSTLMKILVGYIQLKNGTINFDNTLKKNYYLPQDNSLFEWLSGYENLRLSFSDKKIKNHQFFETVRDFIFRKSYTYSFGQARKIEIFRMFLSDSNLICLDEPFNYIDTKAKEYISKLIKDYAKEKMFIISSHYKEDFGLLGLNKIYTFKDQNPTELSLKNV